MNDHKEHQNHSHRHEAGCGHESIQHSDHTDYLHEGHMHRAHGDHFDECSIPVNAANPEDCTPSYTCGGHGQGQRHDAGCDHQRVPHGNHSDYVVQGRLHHEHGGHCDDHGAVSS